MIAIRSVIRFTLATLAGCVAVGVAGALLYAFALDWRFWDNNMLPGAMRGAEDAGVDSLLIGAAAYGLLLTVILDRWARTGGVIAGLKIGAVFGLLAGVGDDLFLFGTTNVMNLTATLVDPLVMAVQMAIGGAAVGAVLGRRSHSRSGAMASGEAPE